MDTTEKLNAALSGRYVIERHIGEGGMASVYLARDVRHSRRVAVKVLKPDLGAILGAERFLTEIQVTANLQHPNLLPLFDSGEADGLLFYVMPFVDGESLRAKLDREKQLPIDDALRIATSIASALEYAHQHNVIHRDLKPENILIQAGQPVIADFGIALAVSNAAGARLTQTGISLGTPQYMSPEQALGDRTIDARTDIYSLGAVTYEMLAGEPPHSGTTAQAIMARLLTEKPHSIRSTRPNVAEHVDAAIHRALEQLPADRFASAREFAEALSGARPAAAESTRSAYNATGAARHRTVVLAGVALASAALGVTGAAILLRQDASHLTTKVFEIAVDDSIALVGALDISRDGSTLAFVGRKNGINAVFVRSFAGAQVALVAGTENAGGGLRFSPDGKKLLFAEGGALRTIPVNGGTPVRIADSVRGGVWSDANEIVYQGNDFVLKRVAASGGTSVVLTRVDTAQYLRLDVSDALPGGRAALITIWKRKRSKATLGVVTIPEGVVTDLDVDGTQPRYAATGQILFNRSGSLYSAPFSLRNRRVTGPAEPVTDGAPAFANSTDGTLVYSRPGLVLRRLVLVDRAGVARSVSLEPGAFSNPRAAPDGRRIAIIRSGVAWVYDLVSGTLTRVGPSVTMAGTAEWLPGDPARLALVGQLESGPSNIVLARADGAGTPELYLRDAMDLAPISFGPPGTYLAVGRGRQMGEQDDIVFKRLGTGPLQPLAVTSAMEQHPAVSRDGKLVAYESDESGGNEVYMVPIPGLERRIQVSPSGGSMAVWSPDGNSLFYMANGFVMEARIVRAPALDVGRRDTLFAVRNLGGAGYDIMPDGQHFVMLEGTAPAQRRLFAVVNWPGLVRK